MLIIGVLLLYGASKMIQLITRSDPLISTAIIENEYDATKVVNFNDLNFRLAFAVQDSID